MEKIGVVEVRRQEGLPAPRARSGGARARARDCRNEPPCEPRTALEQTTFRKSGLPMTTTRFDRGVLEVTLNLAPAKAVIDGEALGH